MPCIGPQSAIADRIENSQAVICIPSIFALRRNSGWRYSNIREMWRSHR